MGLLGFGQKKRAGSGPSLDRQKQMLAQGGMGRTERTPHTFAPPPGVGGKTFVPPPDGNGPPSFIPEYNPITNPTGHGDDMFMTEERPTLKLTPKGRAEQRQEGRQDRRDDRFNREKKFQEEMADRIANPNKPIADALKDRFESDYNKNLPGLMDGIQGEGGAGDKLTGIGTTLANVPGGQRDALGLSNLDKVSLTSDVRSGIQNLGKDRGGVLDEKFKDLAVSGPLGKFYSDKEATLLDNIGAGQGEAGREIALGDIAAFKEQFDPGETELAKQNNANLLAALQGKLSDPDSQYLKAQSDLLQEQSDETMRGLREQAGQRRGIGGGRFDRAMAKEGGNLARAKQGILADLQKSSADKAGEFDLARRGQDIDFANVASGFGSNLGQRQLGGQQLTSSHLLGAGNLDLNRDKLQAAEDQRKFEIEKDRIDRLSKQDQFEKTFGQNERFGQADRQANLVQSDVGNQMGLAGLLQTDKAGQQANAANLLSGVLGAGSGMVGGLAGLASVGKGAGLKAGANILKKLIPFV